MAVVSVHSHTLQLSQMRLEVSARGPYLPLAIGPPMKPDYGCLLFFIPQMKLKAWAQAVRRLVVMIDRPSYDPTGGLAITTISAIG